MLPEKLLRIQFWEPALSKTNRKLSDFPADITHLSIPTIVSAFERFGLEDSMGCQEFINKQYMLEMML